MKSAVLGARFLTPTSIGHNRILSMLLQVEIIQHPSLALYESHAK